MSRTCYIITPKLTWTLSIGALYFSVRLFGLKSIFIVKTFYLYKEVRGLFLFLWFSVGNKNVARRIIKITWFYLIYSKLKVFEDILKIVWKQLNCKQCNLFIQILVHGSSYCSVTC